MLHIRTLKNIVTLM